LETIKVIDFPAWIILAFGYCLQR